MGGEKAAAPVTGRSGVCLCLAAASWTAIIVVPSFPPSAKASLQLIVFSRHRSGFPLPSSLSPADGLAPATGPSALSPWGSWLTVLTRPLGSSSDPLEPPLACS